MGRPIAGPDLETLAIHHQFTLGPGDIAVDMQGEQLHGGPGDPLDGEGSPRLETAVRSRNVAGFEDRAWVAVRCEVRRSARFLVAVVTTGVDGGCVDHDTKVDLRGQAVESDIGIEGQGTPVAAGVTEAVTTAAAPPGL